MIRMLRLNLVVWIGCCGCLLMQAPAWVVGAGHDPPPNRPTQLEDIERDNLNSERQVYKKEAIAQQQQQQQQQHQHGASSTQSNNHYSVQIQHHPGSTAGTHSAVKYVTPLPAPTQTLPYQKGPPHFLEHSVAQQYVSIQQQQPSYQLQQQHQQQQQLQLQQLPQPYQQHYHQQQQQQPVPQVHEDHSTYTVPSRQSLLQPAIGGGAPSQPYLTPQPQYVYVQARPQQLPQYAADNNLPQSLLHILPQNSQAYIMIPTPYYQQQPPHPPSAPAPASGTGVPSSTPAPTASPHSAQQLAAYVNDPDNHIQTYSHGESGVAPSPASSSSSSSTGPSAPQATPQPDIVYAAPSSTPAPARHQSPSAEFSIVKSIEQAPTVYYSHDLPDSAPSPVPSLHGRYPPPQADFPQQQHFTFASAPHHQLHQHFRQHPAVPQHHHHHHAHAHLHHLQQQQQQQQQPQFHEVPSHYPAYTQSHGHSYAPHLYPSLAHPNNGILNYFGVQQRPPTSLIDSYVPSQLQLHKPAHHHQPATLYTTKLGPHPYAQPAPQLQQHHHHRAVPAFYQQAGLPVFPVNPLHTTILQPAGPAPGHAFPGGHSAATAPLLGGPSGPATAPGYNTIAYSVPLAFTKTSAQYKRSPGLFSVAGFARPSGLGAAAAATTKLQPAKVHP